MNAPPTHIHMQAVAPSGMARGPAGARVQQAKEQVLKGELEQVILLLKSLIVRKHRADITIYPSQSRSTAIT